MKIRCIFGFHDVLKCEPVLTDKCVKFDVFGYFAYEHRFKVEPFSVFTIIEVKYRCTECSKTFYYAPGNFEERQAIKRVNSYLLKLSTE